MNPIRHIRRLAAVVAGLAAAVLLATPTLARVVPSPALLAAAAVLADRALAVRCRTATAAA